jgi:hypothetical protein
MMLSFPFLSLTQMASMFDEDAITLGRWLTDAGLRERDPATGQLVPSPKAHRLELVEKVEHNGSEFYAWRNPHTVEILVAAGHSLPATSSAARVPTTTPMVPDTMFSYHRETVSGNTFVIVGSNDFFHGVVVGQVNAERITKMLNHLMQRQHIKPEQGGLGVEFTLPVE